jgi:hypothetical protein
VFEDIGVIIFSARVEEQPRRMYLVTDHCKDQNWRGSLWSVIQEGVIRRE